MKTLASFARNLFWSFAALAIAGVTLSSPAMAQPLGAVADDAMDTVNVIDLGTNTILTSVPIGPGGVGDVALTPEETLALVSDTNFGIWVIDLSTSPPSLASGTNPILISTQGKDIAITPDGRFLLATDDLSFTSRPISVIDVATRQEVFTFPTVGNPVAIDVCDDGTSVLVLVITERSSTAFLSELRRLSIDGSGTLTDTGDTPLPIGFAPRNVYCAPGSATGIVVRDTQLHSFTIPGLALVDTSLTDNAAVSAVMSPTGDRVFVRSLHPPANSPTGSVEAFPYNPETGDLGADPALSVLIAGAPFVFFGIDQLGISADGKLLYVPESDSNSIKAVSVLDAADLSLLATITDLNIVEPTGIALPPPVIAFADNFEFDVLGKPPSTTPAGPPPGDSLILTPNETDGTGDLRSITVVNNVLGSQAAQLLKICTTTDPDCPSTDMFALPDPAFALSKGVWEVTWQAYIENSPGQWGFFAVGGGSGSAFTINYRINGELIYQDGDPGNKPLGTYTPNVVQNFRAVVDFDQGLFDLYIDGVQRAFDASFQSTSAQGSSDWRFVAAIGGTGDFTESYVVDNVFIFRAGADPDVDGIPGASDNCPFVFNPNQDDFDGDGLGDACDEDDDNDGVLDVDDAFPFDPNESVDSDKDGIGNNSDNCPFVVNPDQLDTDGDKRGDVCDAFPNDPGEKDDTDRDGVGDNEDAFPDDPTEQFDWDGNGRGDNSDDSDIDADKNPRPDGIPDALDNCVLVYNPSQSDVNGDGVGDACQDSDGDGTNDDTDICPSEDPNDIDSDRVCAGLGFKSPDMLGDRDNCPYTPNPDQSDQDNDERGDLCDNEAPPTPTTCRDDCPPDLDTADDDGDGLSNSAEAEIGTNPNVADSDGDGIPDGADNCPLPNGTPADPDQTDTDGDGDGDVCDLDDDNDGVNDFDAGGLPLDNCRTIRNGDQSNIDSITGDTLGDACDDDIDGDGTPNWMEVQNGTLVDDPDTDNDLESDGPADPDFNLLTGQDHGPMFAGPDRTPFGDVFRFLLTIEDGSGAPVTETWLPAAGASVNDPDPRGPVTVVAELLDPASGFFTNFTSSVSFVLSPSDFEGRAINDMEECVNFTCQDDLSFASSPGDTNEVDVNATGQPRATVLLYSFDYGARGTITATTTAPDGSTVTGTISVPLDSDDDGVPNFVELEHGFDPFNANSVDSVLVDGETDVDTSAQNNNDGDGINNRMEWRGIILETTCTAGGGESHHRLDPNRKDVFVRGHNFANSCGGSDIADALDFSLVVNDRISEVTDDLGNPISAFEAVGLVLWDVTGRANFIDPADPSARFEPPNLNVVLITNKTNTFQTLETSGDGLIDQCGPSCWKWERKADSYVGTPENYQYFVDQNGNVKRGTFIYDANARNYFCNRPVEDDTEPALNPDYVGRLDPFDLLENYIIENSSNTPDVVGKGRRAESEDRFIRNSFVDGDRYRGDWRNSSYTLNITGACTSIDSIAYRRGYDFSIFDADRDGRVELPEWDGISPLDASSLDPGEYTLDEANRHTILHELCHAMGCNKDHTAIAGDLQFLYSTDWKRAGRLSRQSASEIWVNNATEYSSAP